MQSMEYWSETLGILLTMKLTILVQTVKCMSINTGRIQGQEKNTILEPMENSTKQDGIAAALETGSTGTRTVRSYPALIK